MKQILLDNALESWSIAIKYCKHIKNGLSTLHYKKTFVSSLHNSIELFFKQIMLDKKDKSAIKHIKDKDLNLKYSQISNLNEFVKNLSAEERNKCYSIGFSELITNKTIENNINTIKNVSFNSVLSKCKILQELRNNETHFYISSYDYLSEDQFIDLHNLMILIFEIIKDNNLLPYWGKSPDEYKHLEFNEKELKSFSYLDAAKLSPITSSVITKLNGKQLFCYGDNPFDLTEQYFEELTESNEPLIYDFNDVLAIITLLHYYKLISFEPIVDSEEFESEDGDYFPQQIHYIIKFNI